MMRPGRKSVTTVTPKPLPVRSCTVRVVRKESSSSTPTTQSTTSTWRNTSTPIHEERKFRGPIKKRPISELTQSTPVKANKQNVPRKSTPMTPGTPLVAGRARRNIKPNPKYAAEDIVAPRILKKVSGKDDGNSTDDFFYPDSDDDNDDDDDNDEDSDAYLDDIMGKAFNDSDDTPKIVNSKPNQSAATTTTTPATGPRKRGRPRRQPLASPVDSNNSIKTTTTTTTAKNELLSKTSIGVRQKVPAEKEPKRFVLSNEVRKLKGEHENKTTTRSSSSSTTEASKMTTRPINKTTSYRLKEILDEALGSDMDEMDNDVAAVQKIETPPKTKDTKEQQENISLEGQLKKFTDCRVIIKKTTLPVLRTREHVEQQGKNNATDIKNESPQPTAVKLVTDKKMPTFTIVNINDIISKKGDALVTKSSTASQDAANNNKIQTKTINGKEKHALRKSTMGPTILNHQLANRQKTIANSATKQAPRILNAIVSKKTVPVKPTTQNPYDSAESFTLLLDEDEDEETEIEKNIAFSSKGMALRLTESEDYTEDEKSPPTTYRGRKRSLPTRAEPAKRTKQFHHTIEEENGENAETVEITQQGNKIVKKITCLENWYVITRVNEMSEPPEVRNILKMPLIELANAATALELPNKKWNSKVTLYELPAAKLAKNTFITYTGDLEEHDISENDRTKYQPSCVMFRRAAELKQKSRLPYDRAVIFKNNTFITNIDGKNVRLIGAPHIVDTLEQVEIMLDIIDTLSLQSALVEAT